VQPISEQKEILDLPTGHETILFVDDEPTLVELGQEILQKLGYKVLACTDSQDALKKFNQDPDNIALVISDMTMPKMTGDMLALQMFQTRPNLPVILCTGFSSKLSNKQAVELGVKALINKPLVMGELATVVRKALDEKDNSKPTN
jgi:CheY-like chemotaxis protein